MDHDQKSTQHMAVAHEEKKYILDVNVVKFMAKNLVESTS